MAHSARLLALLFVSTGLIAAAPAGAVNNPEIFPGKYVQVNPVTKKPLAVGSAIVIVRAKSGKLGFSINAIRALDSNQGFIAGVMPHGSHIMWQQRGESGSCRLTFTAVPGGMTVAQDNSFGDCGFGYGVTADGTYRWLGDADAKT